MRTVQRSLIPLLLYLPRGGRTDGPFHGDRDRRRVAGLGLAVGGGRRTAARAKAPAATILHGTSKRAFDVIVAATLLVMPRLSSWSSAWRSCARVADRSSTVANESAATASPSALRSSAQ